MATLKDLIAGRGVTFDGDESIALDRLLPPATESANHWLLRRAATEVLYDDGLRFIRFGSTILPEPTPGQPIDPAAGISLVEGTIRDVLGVGGIDPLSSRLRAVAGRGRVGLILTRIELAPDLASASAESSLYYYNGSDWNRAVWRSQTLEVGAVPPLVLTIVASDPQVKALMNLIDAVGSWIRIARNEGTRFRSRRDRRWGSGARTNCARFGRWQVLPLRSTSRHRVPGSESSRESR